MQFVVNDLKHAKTPAPTLVINTSDRPIGADTIHVTVCACCLCMWKLDTHACMVVVAVWKLNIFSLGNQFVSSAIREKNDDSRVNGKTKEKNLRVMLENVVINILWKHKSSNSTSQSSTPQTERGRHRETKRRRVRDTDHHVTVNIETSTPPHLRGIRFKVCPTN